MPPTDQLDDADESFARVAATVSIAGAIDDAWHTIGDWYGAPRFLGLPVAVARREAGIGSIRRIGTDIVEIMVGASRHSYTYAQVRGPMARHAYHGCVTLEAFEPNACKLTYTVTYDQSDMDADSRIARREQIAARFGGMAEAMRAAAEGVGGGYEALS